MAKKKRNAPILVPVDFSPASEAALLHACEIATCKKVKLILLHVVHDPGDAPGFYAVKGRKKLLQSMEDIAEEMLVEFQQEMAEKHPDVTAIKHAKTKLVVGLPVTRILEMVEHTEAQMVIMGSQGRTRLGQLLLGSKAEQIVRLCPVPVTIVKTTSKGNGDE